MRVKINRTVVARTRMANTIHMTRKACPLNCPALQLESLVEVQLSIAPVRSTALRQDAAKSQLLSQVETEN